MLKALTSLLIAAAATLAFASPAAASPTCAGGHAHILSGPFSNSFLDYTFNTGDWCDAPYSIVSIDWPYGQSFVSFAGEIGYVDGVYHSAETATVTVTDGINTDEFDIIVVPCFDENEDSVWSSWECNYP